jgi:hypothetical protein
MRLEIAVESCVALEICFAALVVAGVVGELWYPLAGDIVVATGVALETVFLGIGHFIQGELNERSNAKLAEVTERAIASERDVIRLTTPRRLVLKGKWEALQNALAAFPKTQFDGAFSGGSGEQADMWWDLAHILSAATWVHLSWIVPDWAGATLSNRQGDLPLAGSVAAANVEIHLLPTERDALLAAATALKDALVSTGVRAEIVAFNSHSANPNAIHIHVGDKD